MPPTLHGVFRVGCAKCHNHPFEAITGRLLRSGRVLREGSMLGRTADDEIVPCNPAARSSIRRRCKNQPPAALRIAWFAGS